MTPPPTRGLQQRQEALALANKIRIANKEMKLMIAALPREGSALLAKSVLLNPDPLRARMRIISLLLAVRKIGPIKAEAILKKGRVSRYKRLSGLTDRQRAAIAVELHRFARSSQPGAVKEASDVDGGRD